jgi:hypothetical protein
MGKVFFCYKAGTQYEDWFHNEMDIPAELMFEGNTAPLQAHDSTTADRNDVILLAPGAYALTAELAYDKDRTHLVGLAGPRTWNDYSEYGVSIYTTTANVAETVDCTADFSQFHGINFTNNCADADNLAAFNLDSYGCIFKGCSFDGAMNTTQDVAAAAALYIDSLGCQALFEDCRIGDNSWWTRDQANSGQMSFVGTNSYGNVWRRCHFLMSSETADCALVRTAVGNSCQKDHVFDGCFFINQSVNWANTLSRVFYFTPSPVTAQFVLMNCIAVGFTEWQSNDTGTLFTTNMPAGNAAGGLAVEATG